jgi:hypothetical protein
LASGGSRTGTTGSCGARGSSIAGGTPCGSPGVGGNGVGGNGVGGNGVGGNGVGGNGVGNGVGMGDGGRGSSGTRAFVDKGPYGGNAHAAPSGMTGRADEAAKVAASAA